MRDPNVPSNVGDLAKVVRSGLGPFHAVGCAQCHAALDALVLSTADSGGLPDSPSAASPVPEEQP